MKLTFQEVVFPDVQYLQSCVKLICDTRISLHAQMDRILEAGGLLYYPEKHRVGVAWVRLGTQKL